MEYLYYLQVAFTIWMLTDAYRRGAEPFWYWVILTGVGSWVYFFAVKAGDFAFFSNLGLFGPRRLSLDELRYQAEQTPTLVTRLALAEGLMERGLHAEAIPYLETALALEPDHCQVLYDLAVCCTEQGHPEKALPYLDMIQARDRRWSDYKAWRLLIAVRGQGGDGQGALELSRELARLAPTLQHRCLLAERLLAEGKADEAGEVLEESLRAHQYAPGPIRRRNRPWANKARQLQKRVFANGGR